MDALIYGRDLGPDTEDPAAEERFDKIRYYLKHGQYPAGADRAEKSRLRSAATHYKLLPRAPAAAAAAAADDDDAAPAERLMLKDKEVVADAERQLALARAAHAAGAHGGINKTTAAVAERYHWTRIKETVALAIRQCAACRDAGGNGGSRTPVETRAKPEPTPTPARELGPRRSGPGADEAREERARANGVAPDPNGQIERLASFKDIVASPPQPALLPVPRDHAEQPAPVPLSLPSAPDAGLGGADGSGLDALPVDPQIMELDAPEYRLYFSDDVPHSAAASPHLASDPSFGNGGGEGGGGGGKTDPVMQELYSDWP